MAMKTAAFTLTLAMAAPYASTQNIVVPPPVPADIVVEAGNNAFLIGHATGTQNYICLPSGRTYAWTFFGPQATLFDGIGEQLLTHYLSPNPDENAALRATWQDSRDTSTVWAVAEASSTDSSFVAPGSIPWLRLRVVGSEYGPQGGDRMTATTYIQRVNTAGGVAPAAGCSNKTDVGRKVMVPYTTDYVFYR